MATEELSKRDARQGEERRTNRTALLVGLPLAVVVLAVLYVMWV